MFGLASARPLRDAAGASAVAASSAAWSMPTAASAGSALARTRSAMSTAPRLYLMLLHDATAEHVARGQADRSQHELDDWFDLSPTGMLLYDDTGLHPAQQPGLRGARRPGAGAAGRCAAHAAAAARAGSTARRAPASCPARRRSSAAAWLALPDGRRQRLRALVRAFDTRRPTPRHGRGGRPQRRGRARPGAARDRRADGHRGRRRRHLRARARLARGRMPRGAQGRPPRRRVQASRATSSSPSRCPTTSACSAR